MIHRKDYTLGLSQIFKKRTIGSFSIEMMRLPEGKSIRTYSILGYFYHDKLAEDFPIVKLMESGNIWMSDSPLEQESLIVPTTVARGDVLIIGLGLGLFPFLLKTKNRNVKTITIIERNQEIVDLVYNKIRSGKTFIRVVNGESYLAATREKYDFIYIDVWKGIIYPLSGLDHWSNLAKRCLKPGGEVRCWLQEFYNRIKYKLPKEPIAATGPPGFHDPCVACGKIIRSDYAGLCMDCADSLGVSELYKGRKKDEA